MSRSQLIEAAVAGRLAAVEELLKSGVDIDEQDEQGWTALKFAAGKGNLSAVKLLARSGADIHRSGRDERSPYRVALAAGHVEVARFLKEAGAEGAPSQQPAQTYCKAYYLSELRQFPGWREKAIKASEDKNRTPEKEQARGDDLIVYLHQDYSVTESMWPEGPPVFDDINEAWREFCHTSLNFSIREETDLARPARAGDGIQFPYTP